MTRNVLRIEAQDSADFSHRQNSFERKAGFETFKAQIEHKHAFGAIDFFAQIHDVSTDVVSWGDSNVYSAQNLFLPPKIMKTKPDIFSSDASNPFPIAETEIFRTDVHRCNSHVCRACRSCRSDQATQFLKVPKVEPESIPKIPNKWWAEPTYDSSWMDTFWTSLTKIMDGEACGPVKYCGGESTKFKKPASVSKYERRKH